MNRRGSGPRWPPIRPFARFGAGFFRSFEHDQQLRRSFETVEFATLEWLDWFDLRRLLEPVGNISPAEAEERYYAMLDEPAMTA